MYSDDLNSIFPDQDVAAEVIQNTADLYVKHKVAPSPEYMGQMGMSSIQMMETGRLAMFLSGNWSLEELSHSEIDYGEAVVPIMGPDYKIWAPSEAIGMSSKTEYPDAAWELYKWVVFGEGSLALSRTGLWQPQRMDLLTTEEGQAKWMTEGVHTEDHVTAACLPAAYNAKIPPARLSHSEVETKYLAPALDPVYTGEKTAEAALNEVVPTINEFLQENPSWMG
jgi:multiple sugar transport system substrate-binding protein